jgi:hypothetical protein
MIHYSHCNIVAFAIDRLRDARLINAMRDYSIPHKVFVCRTSDRQHAWQTDRLFIEQRARALLRRCHCVAIVSAMALSIPVRLLQVGYLDQRSIPAPEHATLVGGEAQLTKSEMTLHH